MVLINALVAGLFLGPGVLSASIPRHISARTAVSKNNVNPPLGDVFIEYTPKNVRRQVAAHSILKPIKLSQLNSLLSGRAKRDTDSAGFVLTDKEKLVYGIAGGMQIIDAFSDPGILTYHFDRCQLNGNGQRDSIVD